MWPCDLSRAYSAYDLGKLGYASADSCDPELACLYRWVILEAVPPQNNLRMVSKMSNLTGNADISICTVIGKV